MNSKIVKLGGAAVVLMLAVNVAVVVLLVKIDSRLLDEFEVGYLCGFDAPVQCLTKR